MFLKNAKIRDFEFRPRFYKPETDEDAKRIKFRKLRHRTAVKRRSFVGMIVIIVVLMFLIRYFYKLLSDDEKNAPIEQLKIEIIE